MTEIRAAMGLWLHRPDGRHLDHGVAASDCEFVAFLDHDDVWFPHHLETLLSLFDRVPDAVMTYSTARHFRGEPVIEAPRHHWPSLIDLWDTFPRSHPFESTSVVVRRSALDEIGGWPTWRRTTTDIYVWFRLADVDRRCRRRSHAGPRPASQRR